ncbi:MAG: hypothetical protein P4L93_04550 [Coriobacteriia bacterium]|nr:hypothetical protein [Coriobacteriia bacterium]
MIVLVSSLIFVGVLVGRRHGWGISVVTGTLEGAGAASGYAPNALDSRRESAVPRAGRV